MKCFNNIFLTESASNVSDLRLTHLFARPTKLALCRETWLSPETGQNGWWLSGQLAGRCTPWWLCRLSAPAVGSSWPAATLCTSLSQSFSSFPRWYEPSYCGSPSLPGHLWRWAHGDLVALRKDHAHFSNITSHAGGTTSKYHLVTLANAQLQWKRINANQEQLIYWNSTSMWSSGNFITLLVKTTLTFKTTAHSCHLQHCSAQMPISIVQEEISGRNVWTYPDVSECLFKATTFGLTKSKRSHLPRVPRAGMGGFSIFPMSPLIRFTVFLCFSYKNQHGQ